MPYASARTKSGTRIGGGTGFWLIAGWFIVPLWLMGQMLKGAIILIARSSRQAAAATPPAIADKTPVIEDAKPPLTQRPQHDATRGNAIAVVVVCVVVALLAILAITGAINL